ncbi:MAG TPA: energy-coupling factor transporter ATPase [Clostridia bacterium]|nr:energy-coupling factor transporter ATPase [Clostridia bacterium]
MSIIEVENVGYSYKQGESEIIPAIKNISFSVTEGDFVTVIGRNGSGKSTLAKLLNGLLLPTNKGTVTINGYSTKNEDTIFEVRRTAGMVFQNPDNQMVATIVEDDIAFGPENLGVPREEIIERVKWALETVGMSEYRNRSASKLSGGQKQRIAIAGVLAMRPKILILDEATSMLDPKGRGEVLEVAQKLNNEGITIILITHNMEEVALSKRAMVLDYGKLAFDGTPRELFKDKDLIERSGLMLPPVAKLSSMLQKSGITLPDGILFAEELVEELCTLLK